MNAQKHATLLFVGTLGWLLAVAACDHRKPTPVPVPSGNEPAAVDDAQEDDGDTSDVSVGRAALVELGATLVEDEQENVTEVNLAHCQVTDSALIYLAEYPKLKKLHLESTQVTDEGMRHLFVLHELRLVNLGETPVTTSGRGELRKKLPRAIVFPLDLDTPLSTPSEFLNRAVSNRKNVKQVPPVYLSEGHQSLCRVMVGDKMPELMLKEPDGSQKALADHYGGTLTVVFFWVADRRQSLELLVDMDLDVARPFAASGVRVVSVAVGSNPGEIKRLLSESGAKFPNLMDPDQSAFAKVGSQRLPRVYLLDSKGKILWFDIEYSLSTRRELLGSIIFLLGNE